MSEYLAHGLTDQERDELMAAFKEDAESHWLCDYCGMPKHRCATWGERNGKPGEKCCGDCDHRPEAQRATSSLERVLVWLIENADRQATADLNVATPSGPKVFHARTWRDGRIVFTPKP